MNAQEGQAAGTALFRVIASHERVMYAATIELIRGKAESALRMLDEQLDGWDGRPWNGSETGAEWLERTREVREYGIDPTAPQADLSRREEP